MRKILLPLEQTERSLKALQYFRKHYSPEEAAIVLLMVDESLPYSASVEEEEAAMSVLDTKLEMIKSFLEGYEVYTKSAVGKAGSRICKVAREYAVSLIAMTKSSRDEMIGQLGKTAQHVIINAPCNVVIISESRDSSEYRGLIYTKAQSVVNLRGQMGNKQSECLLPSVEVDCVYHFNVTVGDIRFFHTVYNPDTGNWDMPPVDDQEVSVDISAGESKAILVKKGDNEGKADRIRIVNRSMKQEAVFSYLITPAEPMHNDAAAAATPAMAEPISVPKESVVAKVEEPAELKAEAPAELKAEAPAEDLAEKPVEEPVAEALNPSSVETAEAAPEITNLGDGFVRYPVELELIEEQAEELEEESKELTVEELVEEIEDIIEDLELFESTYVKDFRSNWNPDSFIFEAADIQANPFADDELFGQGKLQNESYDEPEKEAEEFVFDWSEDDDSDPLKI